MTNHDPFSDPSITFNGKTLEERARELDAEEKARERDARKAELLARKAAREAAENGGAVEEPETESQPPAQTLPQNPVVIPPITSTQGFKIDILADRYRLHNVECQGQLYVVDWSKELLDGKKAHTQDEWVTLTKNSDWKLAPAPFYNATIFALYNNQNHPDQATRTLVETVRQVFSKDFKKYWMMTSTRAHYKNTGNDEVTHSYGYIQSNTLPARLTGSNEYIIPGCQATQALQTVLGTNNMALVEQAYEWIGVQGKKPYVWRINNTPKQNTERAVVLGLNVNVNGFDVIYGIDDDGPARGWSATRAKTP